MPEIDLLERAEDEPFVLPMMTRAVAKVVPKTISDADRTVELVWSAGGKVKRRGIFSDRVWEEELDMADEAVDLSRLQNGAPLLNAHQSYDLNGVVGVVESAEIRGPKGQRRGIATVRFSTRQEVEPIWNDVKTGIIRNVSVGYSVEEWEKSEGKDGVIRMRAVKWTPQEISLVPVPADAASQVRSNDGQAFPCVVRSAPTADTTQTEQETPPMADKNTSQANVEGKVDTSKDNPAVTANVAPAEPVVPPAPPANVSTGSPGRPPENDAEAQHGARGAEDIRVQERHRAAAIRSTAQSLNLRGTADLEVVERMVNDGVALEGDQGARAQLINLAAARSAETSNRPRVETPLGGQDSDETFHRAMSLALLVRGGSTVPAVAATSDPAVEQARQFRGMSLIDMARASLEDAGIATRGRSRDEVVDLALRPRRAFDLTRASLGGLHSTSDFASALNATVTASLREGYGTLAPTYQTWMRRTTVPDFKPVKELMLSDGPGLLKVNEAGEFKRGTFSTDAMEWSIGTFGRVLAFTRQMIINDNVGIVTTVPRRFGRAARDLESNVCYSVLLSNPVMWDGTTLFHANHGNVAGATGVTIAALDAARQSMLAQKGINGVDPAPVRPSILLVPPGRTLEAEQLFGQFAPASAAAVVPNFARSLTIVEEPLLAGVVVDGVLIPGSATTWYLIGDGVGVDTAVFAYLEGQEQMFTDTRVGFDVDGIEFKCRLDFGAAPMDWRGFYKVG